MKVEKNSVVTFDYVLKNPEGEVLDTTEGEEPFDYLHGSEGVLPAVEEALEGAIVGQRLQFVVPCEDAYGERDDELITLVPREEFDDVDDLEVGLQMPAVIDDEECLITVLSISDDEVEIEANHPLAGETLHFDITIRTIRAATPEEIEHGHAHGADGHHHHN